MDGLLRRPALTVDGHPRHGLRQAGRQPGVPGDVNGLGAHLGDAAHDHIFDRGRIDTRPRDQLAQYMGREVYRVNRRKATVPLADGATDRPDDVCLRHDATSMTPAAPPPACTRRQGCAEADSCRHIEATPRFGRRHTPAVVLSSADYRPPSVVRRLLSVSAHFAIVAHGKSLRSHELTLVTIASNAPDGGHRRS